jgi:hypothetical protein
LTAPARASSLGGTLIAALLGPRRTGCQIARRGIIEALMTANHTRMLAVLTAILGAAALRLVPHPPNFSPIDAMALFGGAYLGRRALAFAAPLGAMFVSDAIIGFHPYMWATYLSVVLIVLIGWAVRGRISIVRVGAAAVAGSALFFVLTNFSVWLGSEVYPQTLGGLAACYVAAIPFFQNTLAGDLFFSGLLFGGFALLERLVPVIRERRSAVAT